MTPRRVRGSQSRLAQKHFSNAVLKIDGKTVSYVMNSDSILNGDFDSGQGITIAIGFPKNMVKEPVSSDYWSYFLRLYCSSSVKVYLTPR